MIQIELLSFDAFAADPIRGRDCDDDTKTAREIYFGRAIRGLIDLMKWIRYGNGKVLAA